MGNAILTERKKTNPKTKAKYRLHASQVDRLAIVDRPAVPEAEIIAYKSFDGKPATGCVEFENIVPFQKGIPIDNSRNWDCDVALANVRNWAGVGSESVDWMKYRKAFFYCPKGSEEELTAYKFLFADVHNGTLVISPTALIGIVNDLPKSENDDLSLEEKLHVLDEVEKYLKSAEMDFDVTYSRELINKAEGMSPFIQSFLYRAVGGAVDALSENIWDAIYSSTDEAQRKMALKVAFTDFKMVVVDGLAKFGVIANKGVSNEPSTKEETLSAIKRGFAITGLYGAFDYFKSNLAYLVVTQERFQNPVETISEAVDVFSEIVIGHVKDIVQNKGLFLKNDNSLEVEKAGRILSAVRLGKLRQAVSVLSEIIDEAETRYQTTNKEFNDMENAEIVKKLGEISDSVSKMKEEGPAMVLRVLEEKGLVKSEKEIQAEKAKAEEEAKARNEKEKTDIEKSVNEKFAQVNTKVDSMEAAQKEQGETLKGMKETLDAINKRFAPTQNGEDASTILKNEGAAGEEGEPKKSEFVDVMKNYRGKGK